jgi:hypothetical protein
MVPSEPGLEIRASRVAWLLGSVIVALVVTCLVTQHVRFAYRLPCEGLIRSFDLNREGNVPTVFSFLILLLSAGLLGLAGRRAQATGAPFARHWRVLSGIFVFLAVDEVVGLHELLIQPLRLLLNAGGYFYFAWVIPALILVPLLGIAYLRFLWHLPAWTRWLFIVAAVIFLSGAVGMEMVGGNYYHQVDRQQDMTYSVITTIEETLEMTGISLFVYALWRYLAEAGMAMGVTFRR